MEKRRNSYYDFEFDIDSALIENRMIDDYFWLQDLRQRKLFLNGDIDQFSVHDIVKHILQINREDAGISPELRKPILLYVTSNGGDVAAGFEVIDAVMMSKTPVYTINLGFQYSMGFLIGLAGHKRFATKSAKYLMHDGQHFVYDSSAKAQDRMEFNKVVEARTKAYILSRSKLTPEEYDSKLRVEWFLFADEAKEKGFVDYIIGEDCDLDEVI